MLEKVCLTDLKAGQKGIIEMLSARDDMRRRLQDIGLIEGTVVECLGRSPLGDPTAFLIRGAVIALRSEDSGNVLVQPQHAEKMKYQTRREVTAAAVALEEQLWD